MPEAGAEFGFAVATRGGLHVVGAFLQDRAATDSGAAYVFERQTVQLAGGPASVQEGDSLALAVLREGSAARDAVTVPLRAAGGNAEEGVGGDYLLPASVTIPRGADSIDLDVQILDDLLVEGNETFVVALGEPQGAALGCRFRHIVEIVDDDGPGIVLIPLQAQALVTGEDGTTGQFTVQLASPPAAEVTVAFTAVPDEATFLPPTVRFPSANGDEPQTVAVTVIGKDDAVFDGDVPYAITGVATSADPAYQGRSATLTAVNLDDDHTRVSGTQEVCVFEDGTVNYTVKLTNTGTIPQREQAGDEFTDSLPGDSLSLLMAVADSGAATVDFGSNTASWNGRIPPAGQVTITLIAALQPGVEEGTEVSNQGTIFYDRDNRNGKESAVLTDDPNPDLPGVQDPTVFTVGTTPCAPSSS
jgi:hypothetical protein